MSWQRGKRVAYTRAAAVHAGEARWDETLTLVVPLHTDTKTNKVRKSKRRRRKAAAVVSVRTVGPPRERQPVERQAEPGTPSRALARPLTRTVTAGSAEFCCVKKRAHLAQPPAGVRERESARLHARIASTSSTQQH